MKKRTHDCSRLVRGDIVRRICGNCCKEQQYMVDVVTVEGGLRLAMGATEHMCRGKLQAWRQDLNIDYIEEDDDE